MASMTKSASGAVTTYVITSVNAATITVAVTTGAVTGNTFTVTTSAAVDQDAIVTLANLVQVLMGGLLLQVGGA
jgi:hypothetical protein